MDYKDLSKEQQEFIDMAKSGVNILVDACIGSGKTTAIQALCNELPANKNILYLTYNRLLKIDAKEKIKQSNATVTNYNGFAYMCLIRAGIKCGISDQFQVFNQTKPKLPKHYDILIIDEYQDIEEEMTKMLWYIKEENPLLQIVAVGDMEQKIYDKTILDVPSFMDEFLGHGYVKMNFTRCFRLSKKLAQRYGNIWGKPIIGVNKDCKVEYMSQYDVGPFLAKHDPSEILCLGARTGAMSKTLNWLEEHYSSKFNKSTVYASINDENRGAVEPGKDVAIFTTFDSSKGLERPICVVFDYTEDYWGIRKNQPSTNATILRNIFCVAGSRGKERIIFVKSPNKFMLEDETLQKADSTCVDFKRPFMASDMYDFKYREDVEALYQMLDIKEDDVANEDGMVDNTKIDISESDDMIDMSPCIGIYQEAMFFNNYQIDDEIELASKVRDRKIRYRTGNPNLREKILALVAIDTQYDRYITQASVDFVDKHQEEAIRNRLKLVFTGEEDVQKDCSIVVETEAGNELVFDGRIDVDKDGTIYELKFKEEIGHEDYLQLAFYLIACNKDYGYIWNVKTNERYKVYAPNETRFINKLVPCVTKHKFKSGKLVTKSDTMQDIEKFKRNDRREKSPSELKRIKDLNKLFSFEFEWFQDYERELAKRESEQATETDSGEDGTHQMSIFDYVS